MLSPFLLAAALLCGACANVDVDSSASGDHAIAAAKTVYLDTDMPETDDFRHPRTKFQKQVDIALQQELQSKGYTIVDSPDEADIIIKGSWEVGRVLASKQRVSNSEQQQSGTRSNQASYLTLTAEIKGENNWSAQAPVQTVPDDIDAMLKSFPAQGGGS